MNRVKQFLLRDNDNVIFYLSIFAANFINLPCFVFNTYNLSNYIASVFIFGCWCVKLYCFHNRSKPANTSVKRNMWLRPAYFLILNMVLFVIGYRLTSFPSISSFGLLVLLIPLFTVFMPMIGLVNMVNLFIEYFFGDFYMDYVLSGCIIVCILLIVNRIFSKWNEIES